ncbi:DUF6233 domain-containing protein [Streptomyces lydicus]|uniref:DUF6233 domain-containing protein n=1 Tax=Streptomyces lydicus TaxID=47763 RepID=UPI0036FAC0A9
MPLFRLPSGGRQSGGECRTAGGRAHPISRDQAVRALPDELEPCGLRRPDTKVSILLRLRCERSSRRQGPGCRGV